MAIPDSDSRTVNTARPVLLHALEAGIAGIAAITFAFEGKYITVTVSNTSSSGTCVPLENEIVRLIHLAIKATTEDECNDIISSAIGEILDVGEQEFRRAEHDGQCLEALLYPMLFFTFQTTTSGKASVVQTSQEYIIRCTDPPSSPGAPIPFNISIGYYPARYFIPDEVVRFQDRAMGRVNLAGQEFFCKAYQYGFGDPRFKRELDVLMRIEMIKDLEPNSNIQIPPLAGYIINELGAVIGLLQGFVPGGSCYGTCLADVIMAQVPRGIRERWAIQIRGTVENLNSCEVIWRDCRSSNILIDEKAHLWLSPVQLDSEPGWIYRWDQDEETTLRNGRTVDDIINSLEL